MGCRKLGLPFGGVHKIRIVVFLGSILGFPNFGKLPCLALNILTLNPKPGWGSTQHSEIGIGPAACFDGVGAEVALGQELRKEL